MIHTPHQFFYYYGRRILIIAIAGGVVALVLSIVQPLKYSATMRVLIIQATSPTLDAFTAVKSAEKVGRNLGRVIASSSFLGRVLQANPAIDQSFFSNTERKRRKTWEKMIETSVASETSVMEIRVFHQRQAQALAIAEAIGAVLVRDTGDYTGSRDLAVKIIDPPLISRYPAKPNIPFNAFLGLVIGAFLGSAWFFLRLPQHQG